MAIVATTAASVLQARLRRRRSRRWFSRDDDWSDEDIREGGAQGGPRHVGRRNWEDFSFRIDKDEDFLVLIRKAFKAADSSDHCGGGVLGKAELLDFWRFILPGMDEHDLTDLVGGLAQDIEQIPEISWPEVEHFFNPDPRFFTSIDAMVHDHIVQRAPTRKETVWYIFDIDAPQYTRMPRGVGLMKKVIALISNVTIMTSIANFVAETAMPKTVDQAEDTSGAMYIVEAACIAIFSIEFVVRLYAAPSQRDLWTNFYTWIDVLAILPFYVSVLMMATDGGSNPSGTLVVLRVLRLLRLLRLLKLGRSFEAVQVLVIAVSRTLYPLMVSVIGINSVAVLLFASLMFSAEQHEAVVNPGTGKLVRRNDSQWEDKGMEISYQSIPHSMWWAWVTITTVGYGDMYPKTGPGKAVASLTMLSGLVLMAFPLTLLAGSFGETHEELRAKKSARDRARDFRAKVLLQQKMWALAESDLTRGFPPYLPDADATEVAAEHDKEDVTAHEAGLPADKPDRRNSLQPLVADPDARCRSRESKSPHTGSSTCPAQQDTDVTRIPTLDLIPPQPREEGGTKSPLVCPNAPHIVKSPSMAEVAKSPSLIVDAFHRSPRAPSPARPLPRAAGSGGVGNSESQKQPSPRDKSPHNPLDRSKSAGREGAARAVMPGMSDLARVEARLARQERAIQRQEQAAARQEQLLIRHGELLSRLLASVQRIEAREAPAPATEPRARSGAGVADGGPGPPAVPP